MKKSLFHSFALALVLVALCHADPQASEQQLEVAVGQSNIETAESDDDADAAGVRYFASILDHLGGGVALERLNGDDISGAWCVDALLRGHYTHKLVSFYVQGGIGAVISDIEERTEEIAVSVSAEAGGGHGNHEGASVEASAAGEIETHEQQVGLRGSVAAGFQVHFSGAMRQGVGIEYGYAAPIGDGFAIESDRQLRAYYILPVGGY